MSDTDLLVLAPWVVFAGGVATLMILALTRDHRGGRLFRKWRRRRDRR